jgi:hypothetical protein
MTNVAVVANFDSKVRWVTHGTSAREAIPKDGPFGVFLAPVFIP